MGWGQEGRGNGGGGGVTQANSSSRNPTGPFGFIFISRAIPGRPRSTGFPLTSTRFLLTNQKYTFPIDQSEAIWQDLIVPCLSGPREQLVHTQLSIALHDLIGDITQFTTLSCLHRFSLPLEKEESVA